MNIVNVVIKSMLAPAVCTVFCVSPIFFITRNWHITFITSLLVWLLAPILLALSIWVVVKKFDVNRTVDGALPKWGLLPFFVGALVVYPCLLLPALLEIWNWLNHDSGALMLYLITGPIGLVFLPLFFFGFHRLFSSKKDNLAANLNAKNP
jgi:hypothetical protein